MRFHNPNLTKHPDDPDYVQDYDAEEEYKRFERAAEERADFLRDEQ